MYNPGDRVLFIWRSKQFPGRTPGTVKYVKRNMITVSWDDGTSTRTSQEFLNRNTKRLKSVSN